MTLLLFVRRKNAHELPSTIDPGVLNVIGTLTPLAEAVGGIKEAPKLIAQCLEAEYSSYKPVGEETVYRWEWDPDLGRYVRVCCNATISQITESEPDDPVLVTAEWREEVNT